jgi:hypothetical protein
MTLRSTLKMAMGGPSLNFNLTMLNLWIGMCRGVAGLPKDLRRMGYQDKCIEYSFANQDVQQVVPDLMLASEQMRHTLLLEWKSGANTEADQLRRYSRVNENDLRTKAFISRDAARSHDVTVVGRDEYGDRLRIGIDGGGYPFPMLLADDEGLALRHNQFEIAQLTNLFSPRLAIDWDQVPSRFVPLDRDSELWEVAEVLAPKLLHYMWERRPQVALEQICADICNTWSIMGPPAKDALKRRVREALSLAARQHFRQYLRWVAAVSRIEIVANPLELEPDKRTAAYRKLKTLQKKFIDSLRTGRAADSGEQLELPFDSTSAGP